MLLTELSGYPIFEKYLILLQLLAKVVISFQSKIWLNLNFKAMCVRILDKFLCSSVNH